MSISNYTELQGAVNDYLVYSDVGAVFDTFLAMAEAKLNREIRIREMEDDSTFSSIVAGSSGITLPANFIELIDVYETGSAGRTLSYLPPNSFWGMYNSRTGSGQPKYYTMIGNALRFSPASDSARAYVMHYYQGVANLTPSAATNVILTKAPDVYLYAVLLEAQPYLADDARQLEFSALYERAKDSLHAADARSKLRPGARMKAQGVSPDGEFRNR